jgi:hypothetical protein
MRDDVRNNLLNGHPIGGHPGYENEQCNQAYDSTAKVAVEPNAQQYLAELIQFTHNLLEGYKALSRALPQQMFFPAENALKNVLIQEIRRVRGY